MLRIALYSLLMGACAFAQQGVDQFRAGKLTEAEQSLKGENDPKSQFYLVMTLAEADKVLEAEQVAKTLTDGVPNDPWTKLAEARMAIQRKQFDKAEAALSSEGVDAASAEATFMRGVLEAVKRNNQAAADKLEEAIQKDPSNAYAHYYAGLAYSGLRRQDKMVNHFRDFLRLAPDAPQARKVQSLMQASK